MKKKELVCMFCGKDYGHSNQQERWIIEYDMVCCPKHYDAFRRIWALASKLALEKVEFFLKRSVSNTKILLEGYDTEWRRRSTDKRLREKWREVR